MQRSFSDLDYADCLSCLKRQGDLLSKLKRSLPWESFRGDFKGLHKQGRQDKGKGGRTPTDCILMPRIPVLQDMRKLADGQAEDRIHDRLSFQDFLGLSVSDKVPDARTIWFFRKRLKEKGLLSNLFERLLSHVNAAGFTGGKGRIVDASIAEVPRQCNSRDGNARVKSGGTPLDWPKAKRRRKDAPACWTGRHGQRQRISIDRVRRRSAA